MKIEFVPADKTTNNVLNIPEPANRNIPEWYKNMPQYIDKNDKKRHLSALNKDAPNTTMKSCSPFLDALTFGYIWSSPADIEFRRDFDESGRVRYSFSWRTEGDLVTHHTEDQHPTLPIIAEGTDPYVLKWSFNFVIKTPPGYSTFFTHPLNRYELPFRTLSGVVDTDKYILPVQFPFQLITKDLDFPYIIEKGTPLCQIIPFKREKWKSKIKKMTEEQRAILQSKMKNTFIGEYKKLFYEKKYFE